MNRRKTPVQVTVNETTREYRHPSFGIMQLFSSRGGSGRLFGSPIQSHSEYVTLRIYKSGVEIHRHHETIARRDHGAPLADLVCEIRMSYAQFATFIMSEGNGEGVPCTFETLNGAHVPQPEEGQDEIMHDLDRTIQSATEHARDAIARSHDLYRTLEDALQESGLSAQKRARVLARVLPAFQGLRDVPFGADQIREAGRRVLHVVRVEADAILTRAAQRVGFASLARFRDVAEDLTATPAIEGPKGSSDEAKGVSDAE